MIPIAYPLLGAEEQEAVLQVLASGQLAQGDITGIHFQIPIHLQLAGAHYGYRRGMLPVIEAVAERMVSLPMQSEPTWDSYRWLSVSLRRLSSLKVPNSQGLLSCQGRFICVYKAFVFRKCMLISFCSSHSKSCTYEIFLYSEK